MPNRPLLLLSINQGGIAHLSDNSTWRVAHGMLPDALQWPRQTPVRIERLSDNEPWSYRLVNEASQTAVSVLPSGLASDRWPIGRNHRFGGTE
jgi:hypothetical protein